MGRNSGLVHTTCFIAFLSIVLVSGCKEKEAKPEQDAVSKECLDSCNCMMNILSVSHAWHEVVSPSEDKAGGVDFTSDDLSTDFVFQFLWTPTTHTQRIEAKNAAKEAAMENQTDESTDESGESGDIDDSVAVN